MSDHPRVRRKDPERSAPIREWSTMLRNPGAQSPAAAAREGEKSQSAADEMTSGPAEGTTSALRDAALSEEARIGIETAYRVIDEHLEEGRRAAQAREGRAENARKARTSGTAGMGIAADGIQEVVAQGLRFYTSLAPLWGSLINSIVNSSDVNQTAADGPSTKEPTHPGTIAGRGAAPVIIEIASAKMARVAIELPPQTDMSRLAVGGLHALEPDKPALSEVALATEAGSNRPVVRIRVPENHPAGLYSGVIIDRASGEPRGTITVRIDA